MDILVETTGEDAPSLAWGAHRIRCAIGRGGAGREKREGDGVTPIGRFPLRRILYRHDRVSLPESVLPCRPILPGDGWCDEPGDVNYNRPVRLPYVARHENLYREDGLYDIVVVIGYNDRPVVPGLGSAIFLHCARDDYGPTEGCVAIERASLKELIRELDHDSWIDIRG